jgi:hypothetical protein
MMTVSGDVVPCNLAETYRSFRGADDDDGARMMAAVSKHEMSVSVYKTTRRSISAENYLTSYKTTFQDDYQYVS